MEDLKKTVATVPLGAVATVKKKIKDKVAQ